MSNQQYDQIKHDLETKMLNASRLKTEPEQRGFINRTFTGIHTAYTAKQINHAEYVKLINRLAVYARGSYNDYIDVLAGAAQMGMLELATQGELPTLSPEQARKRSKAVTDLTGVQPIEPDEDN